MYFKRSVFRGANRSGYLTSFSASAKPVWVSRFRGGDGRHSLVQHANAATADELFDVVDEEAICGDGDVVRFQYGAELAGFFEIKQNFSFTRCVEQDGVDLFEQGDVGVVERDLDAEGVRQLDPDVFERLNVREGKLGGRILFPAQDAADDDVPVYF